MFRVDETTGQVTMNVGDTGAWFIAGARDDDVPFTADDRAVFTVKDGAGTIKLVREYGLADANLGNGVIHVQLDNNDTDEWPAGSYTYEVRFVVNPYREGGEITSGDIVDTPGIDGNGDPIPMTLKAVQAKI